MGIEKIGTSCSAVTMEIPIVEEVVQKSDTRINWREIDLRKTFKKSLNTLV